MQTSFIFTVTHNIAKSNNGVIHFIKQFAKTVDTGQRMVAMVDMVVLDKLVEASLVSIAILKQNAIGPQ